MKIGHFYLVKHRTFLNCFDIEQADNDSRRRGG